MADVFDTILNSGDAFSAQTITDLSTLAAGAATTMGAKAQAMATLIAPEVKAVFLALLFPILVAEISFTGIRIMMRAPVVEQLAKLTTTTFILLILWTGVPMAIIGTARTALRTSGRDLGHAMVENLKDKADPAVTATLPAEPIGYWAAWIGVGQATSNPAAYKFSNQYLYNHIWGRPYDSTIGGTGPTASTPWTVSGLVGEVTTGFAAVFLPVQVFMMSLAVAGIQVTGIMTSVFACMAILVGSDFAYYTALALGFATLPLMYFSSFNKIWAQYLTGLTALALVPFFYYLFSAIGFIFATNLFDQLFPGTSGSGSGNTGGSLAKLLNTVFLDSVKNVSQSVSTKTGGSVQLIGPLFNQFAAAFITIGYIGLASSIVTAFIFGGVSFSSLAVSTAFRWNQAFATEEMLSKINEFFSGLQSSIGTGLGNLYGEGMQRGSAIAGGAARGIGGRK